MSKPAAQTHWPVLSQDAVQEETGQSLTLPYHSSLCAVSPAHSLGERGVPFISARTGSTNGSVKQRPLKGLGVRCSEPPSGPSRLRSTKPHTRANRAKPDTRDSVQVPMGSPGYFLGRDSRGDNTLLAQRAVRGVSILLESDSGSSAQGVFPAAGKVAAEPGPVLS